MAATRGNPWHRTRVPHVLHLLISRIYILCLYSPAESTCPRVEIKVAGLRVSEGVRVMLPLYPRVRVTMWQVLPIAAASREGIERIQRPEELPGRVPQRDRVFGWTRHVDFSRHRCGLCVSVIVAAVGGTGGGGSGVLACRKSCLPPPACCVC